ncbi:TetR/AcrR family transcriptional regulator [Natranaerofaba carboxydovora]|uniref:TetR/AcrR family transcriptional regulator n=1 Tax=Natranaerofaba carboxydovora TaxID=2742683 RepID=UPI001F13EEEA|nr:TetR/AcrR family transcriptional regulator [Natranaerofaba carboxydovora]UMZ73465.1 putative HTH-type transcriptional regulator YvdT [Natranaerofaba carboxydovora]
MSEEKIPKTKKGQKTREKLLYSAKKVFGKKGYYQTSISDITKEAEVGHGTFYIYFESKRAILEALIQYLNKDLRQNISDELLNSKDRIEAEEIGLRVYFDYVRKNPELYKIVFESQFVDYNLFINYYKMFVDSYKKALEEAINKHEIKDLDPEVIAYCIIGISNFIGFRWLMWQDEENRGIPEEIFEDVMKFIKYGISPENTF